MVFKKFRIKRSGVTPFFNFSLNIIQDEISVVNCQAVIGGQEARRETIGIRDSKVPAKMDAKRNISETVQDPSISKHGFPYLPVVWGDNFKEVIMIGG